MYTATEISTMNKPQLIEALKSMDVPLQGNEDKQQLANMLKLAIEMATNPKEKLDTKEVVKVRPDINSSDPDWTDYVLSLLWDSELVSKTNKDKIDRFPKADGLRRVFEQLVGPILSIKRDVIQVPQLLSENISENSLGVATVKVRIEYYKNNDLGGRIYSFDEVADCYGRNTIAPYSYHPTGTASTMAEGRALRKILNLKALTIEEMRAEKTEKEGDVIDSPVTENQKNLIVRLCGKLGKNIDEYVTKTVGVPKEKLTYSKASEVIQSLNDLQRKG